MELADIVNVTLLATTFTTLFVIMDPPGTIPVFLALTANYSDAEQKKAARQATATAFGVIVLFAVLGRYILQFLQISMEALQLAGGVLLFIIAMQLLMGEEKSDKPDTGDRNVNAALVPLGTPLLAGPGAIVAVMIAAQQGGNSVAGWSAVLIAVVLIHLVIWATMRFSVLFSRLLGQGGVMILTKVAGLLLAAIAIQMIMEAIFQFISGSQAAGVI